MSDAISFVLNGQDTHITVRPDTTVLDLIRDHLGLKGTKEGCAEGDCGACTVLLRRPAINGGKANAANACIMTAAQIDGAEITTVEGLRNDGVLNAVQSAMAENGSSQCGFCTPGIVMALTGLADTHDNPSEDDIHDALAGNLCRCTGYRPIVEAAQKAIETQSSMTVEPRELPSASSDLNIGSVALHRPKNLIGLLALRATNPDATLLAGGTDLGVARAGYETDWDKIILTDGVEELREISTTDEKWTFGAAVSWAEVLDVIKNELPSFATLIRRFGSTQIRSMGTIGGNIGTASPIGDGPPALIVLNATINLAEEKNDSISMPLADFFLDYRKTALPENGVIVSIEIPRPKPDEFFRVYKISKRYDQDISTVCGAFWLQMDDDLITDARVAYGGMAAIPKRASSAEKCLIGNPLTIETMDKASAAIAGDFEPLSDWRGSIDYRKTVAAGLLKRLLHDYRGETIEVMSL